MVDLTNAIYTEIKKAVQSVYPSAAVKKTYQSSTQSFPCVTIDDIGNREIGRNLSGTGKQSSLLWQIDIYADGSTGELVAKEIRDVIVSTCEDKLFLTRDDSRRTVNVADTSIYRWTLRYSCRVSEDNQCIY